MKKIIFLIPIAMLSLAVIAQKPTMTGVQAKPMKGMGGEMRGNAGLIPPGIMIGEAKRWTF